MNMELSSIYRNTTWSGKVELQGVRRQAQLLDAISDAPEFGASITGLCVATGLPKGTVHRMLESMQQLGMVVQEESKRWRLGPRVAFWAGKYLEGPSSLEPLKGFVGMLSRETQFFSYLAILDQRSIVCVQVQRPEHKAHFFAQLGGRIPVLSTAAAKALLAFQPSEVVIPVVEQAIAENPKTRLGTVTVESYLEELAETRRCGYAKCMEELEIGVSALSAPVKNVKGHSVASLSVVAPTAALAEEWDATVDGLRRIAEEASTLLGRDRDLQGTEDDGKGDRWF